MIAPAADVCIECTDGTPSGVYSDCILIGEA
jgi:hypothetical protein